MKRFLVTRAEPEAARTAERIRARGGEALVAPMLRIRPTPADTNFADAQALLFTSANGVRAFARLSRARVLPALCVGETTARAAREAGFADVRAGESGAAALAALAAASLDPAAGALLHICGAHVAFDLAGALTAQGFRAERRVFYAAHAADELPAAIHARLAQATLDAVLFHSPRGASVFCALADSVVFPTLDAACLSDSVARAASVSPWRRMIVPDAPREEALLTAAFAQAGAEA